MLVLSFMFTHKCVAIISWSSDICHSTSHRCDENGRRELKKIISKITFNNWIRSDDNNNNNNGENKSLHLQIVERQYDRRDKKTTHQILCTWDKTFWYCFDVCSVRLEMCTRPIRRSGFYLSSSFFLGYSGRLHFSFYDYGTIIVCFLCFPGWCGYFKWNP